MFLVCVLDESVAGIGEKSRLATSSKQPILVYLKRKGGLTGFEYFDTVAPRRAETGMKCAWLVYGASDAPMSCAGRQRW